MGFIDQILSSFFDGSSRELQCGSDALNPRTAHWLGPAGIDSSPVKGDYCLVTGDKSTSDEYACCFIDAINEPSADHGEVIVYSRNSFGDVLAKVNLSNDGSIDISNEKGSVKLNSDGSINLNGVIIDTAGNISCSSVIASDVSASDISAQSIKAAGKELANHTHPHGDPVTGPNT